MKRNAVRQPESAEFRLPFLDGSRTLTTTPNLYHHETLFMASFRMPVLF